MIMQFLGGLGLFIYGMKQMGEGLQKAAGKKLRRFLAVLTNRPFKAVLVGTGVTAIIQRSTATTVMVVGFVNAGLMTLVQSVGVIMGANIGTTVTAQLVSFDLGSYAFHAIAIGGFTFLFSGKQKYKYIGQILLGFGILFLGLNIMQDTVYPLRDSVVFVDWMKRFSLYPVLGLFVGIIITLIVQSSTATFGILVSLVAAGVIDFQAGLPILLGSNIGTTVTAVLSSLGANWAARRAALAHFIFNVLGSVIMLILLYIIPDFAFHIENLLRFLSRSETANINRLLANTHTFFNILNTLIWLPFMGFLVSVVQKIMPAESVGVKRGLIYLDERMLETPGVVMDQVQKELTRMHEIARDMVHEARDAFLKGDFDKVSAVRHKEEIVNEIEEELLHFLTRIPQAYLSENDIQILDMYFAIIDDIENIADDADNLVSLAEVIAENKLEFSEQAIEELEKMFSYIEELLEKSIALIRTEDIEKYAQDLIEGEEKMDKLQRKHRNDHMRRLNEGVCLPGAGIVFLEALEDLEHISDQFSDMAQSYLERMEAGNIINQTKKDKKIK